MPMEALFNEMNHAHKTVGADEKKNSIADTSPKTDLGRGEKKFVEIKMRLHKVKILIKCKTLYYLKYYTTYTISKNNII